MSVLRYSYFIGACSNFPRIFVVEAEFVEGVFSLCKRVCRGLKYRNQAENILSVQASRFNWT